MPITPTQSSPSSPYPILHNTDSSVMTPMSVHPRAGDPPSPPAHYNAEQRKQWEFGFNIESDTYYRHPAPLGNVPDEKNPFEHGSYHGQQWRRLNERLWESEVPKFPDFFEK